MMDHNDRPPEQVKGIHTGEGIGIDQEKIIASKVSVDKGSATARASKLAARLLALVIFLPQLQRSPFFTGNALGRFLEYRLGLNGRVGV
jgi:hypothetical protein